MKYCWLRSCFLGVAMFYTGSTFAGVCEDVKAFPLVDVTFTATNVRDAVQQLSSAGSASAVITLAGDDRRKVKLTSVSGAYGVVLSSLLSKVGGRVSFRDKERNGKAVCDVAITLGDQSKASRSKSTASTFDLAFSDKTVGNAMSRWGKSQPTPWQVIWDVPRDFPVVAETRFTGDFKQVVRDVVSALKTSDAPIKAVFHSNNVVRIVPFDGNSVDK